MEIKTDKEPRLKMTTHRASVGPGHVGDSDKKDHPRGRRVGKRIHLGRGLR